MPIIVEPLNQATSQDQQDLQKIYRDAPDWLFTPFAGDSQLIDACLQDGSLIAGRFNDRLLGAARLNASRTSGICLICACENSPAAAASLSAWCAKHRTWPRNRVPHCACCHRSGTCNPKRWPQS